MSSPSLYKCHIDTKIMNYLGGREISKGMDVYPDTLEESIWNKARMIYLDYGKLL